MVHRITQTELALQLAVLQNLSANHPDDSTYEQRARDYMRLVEYSKKSSRGLELRSRLMDRGSLIQHVTTSLSCNTADAEAVVDAFYDYLEGCW